jgi:hypothetical protein
MQIRHLGAATRNRGAKTEINGFGVTGQKPLAPPLVLADTSPIPISLPLPFPLPRAPRLYSCPPPPYLLHRSPPLRCSRRPPLHLGPEKVSWGKEKGGIPPATRFCLVRSDRHAPEKKGTRSLRYNLIFLPQPVDKLRSFYSSHHRLRPIQPDSGPVAWVPLT